MFYCDFTVKMEVKPFLKITVRPMDGLMPYFTILSYFCLYIVIYVINDVIKYYVIKLQVTLCILKIKLTFPIKSDLTSEIMKMMNVPILYTFIFYIINLPLWINIIIFFSVLLHLLYLELPLELTSC